MCAKKKETACPIYVGKIIQDMARVKYGKNIPVHRSTRSFKDPAFEWRGDISHLCGFCKFSEYIYQRWACMIRYPIVFPFQTAATLIDPFQVEVINISKTDRPEVFPLLCPPRECPIIACLSLVLWQVASAPTIRVRTTATAQTSEKVDMCVSAREVTLEQTVKVWPCYLFSVALYDVL